ncbi:MAG: hypothetical protein ACRCSN_06825 [Dermatophilaceae bacterium]
MPEVSVYLPDDFYRAVQERQLPLSAVTQDAVRVALRAADNRAWVARMKARTRRRAKPFDTAQVMDEVRDELGS